MDARSLLGRYGDLLLAGALAVSMTTELLASSNDVPAVDLLVGLLASVPLSMRRREPLVAFLLTMTGLTLLMLRVTDFDNDSATFVVAYLIALYSLGRHTTGVQRWLGACGVVVVMVMLFAADAGVGRVDAGDVAFAIGLVGAPWGAGLAVRLRREREATLNADNARLRLDQEQRAARAVAEERSRIARELHDVVSHAIVVTVLQARGARRSLDVDLHDVRTALDAIEQTNTSALGDMRRLLAVLRDTEPEAALDGDRAPQPSLDHLDQLVAQTSASGVVVDVDVVGEPQPLPPGVDLSAYRIVQEALTNVLKHTTGARVLVRLAYTDGALSVTVVDDGAPRSVSDPGRRGGRGLVGIRERVAVIGGEVEAGPRQQGGYEIRARLPYSLEVS